MQTILAILSIFSFASASAIVSRDTSLGQIWAYGKNASGLPLIYADGYAYLGNAPSNSTVSTNLTVSLTDTGMLEVAATNITNLTTSYIAINTQAGAFDPVEIAASPNTTDTGFATFGKLLVWMDDNGVQSHWWAEKVQTDSWLLKWNVDNTVDDGGVSVVLKNLAPKT